MIRHQPYVSEFEQFLDDFKRQHPTVEKQQREGFAIWWDKPPLNLKEMEREKMSEVKWDPYPYH